MRLVRAGLSTRHQMHVQVAAKDSFVAALRFEPQAQIA